jgi:hypothetical protein
MRLKSLGLVKNAINIEKNAFIAFQEIATKNIVKKLKKVKKKLKKAHQKKNEKKLLFSVQMTVNF